MVFQGRRALVGGPVRGLVLSSVLGGKRYQRGFVLGGPGRLDALVQVDGDVEFARDVGELLRQVLHGGARGLLDGLGRLIRKSAA